MPEVPPFFRRLASLAQAALIQRQVMGLGISIDHFFDWAYSIRGEQFLLQSFADMRTEPRWPPDFAAASQMKADFLGRMIIAGEIFKNHIFAPDLRNILFGSGPESLASHVELPKQFFPGPLEGNEESPLDLPEDVAKEVERQVGVDEVELSSFTVLVNAGLIFRVELKQAELAAKALKLGDYRLANVEDRLKFIATLKGLAVVAAVSRGKPLADELRILVRRYRRDPEYTLSIDEALRVCLVASASRKDIKSWCDFVGDWLTELAFEEFHGDEGTALESHLQCLLHAVPDLWRYCGRADAALKAYCGH